LVSKSLSAAAELANSPRPPQPLPGHPHHSNAWHPRNCVNHMRKVNSIAAHNPTSIFKFQATKRRAHTDKCCTIDDRRTHFLSHRLYHELVGIEAYGSCITRQVLEYWRTHTGKSTNHPTRCLIGTNIFRGAWQGP